MHLLAIYLIAANQHPIMNEIYEWTLSPNQMAQIEWTTKYGNTKYGNHVIQKCIECIPQHAIEFIVSTFYGQVVILSTHPYGYRVIQVLITYIIPLSILRFTNCIMQLLIIVLGQWCSRQGQRCLGGNGARPREGERKGSRGTSMVGRSGQGRRWLNDGAQ